MRVSRRTTNQRARSARSTSFHGIAPLNISVWRSRRFGRGVDPDLTALGVARATELTLELAGGKAAAGLADEYPGREPPRQINVHPGQIDALIGTRASAAHGAARNDRERCRI